jgi:phosphatidylglycerol:prolipoprotein diacylglycerol transferase
MYPYFFGLKWLSSYTVMMVVGILAAVILFRVLCSVKKIDDEAYSYYSTAGLVSIAVGLFSAFLFQALYDFAKSGEFELSGLTFMGGLVGGVVCFVLFALVSKKPTVKKAFFPVAELAIPCVSLAHFIGRIGCFLAGCCHGKVSEHGIFMPAVNATVIPTQAYEAAFLLVLTGVLIFLTLKVRSDLNLIIYAFSYSIFRFIIEFFRGDDRGAFLGALSPSQVQSIILFLVGVALLVLKILSKKTKRDDAKTSVD